MHIAHLQHVIWDIISDPGSTQSKIETVFGMFIIQNEEWCLVLSRQTFNHPINNYINHTNNGCIILVVFFQIFFLFLHLKTQRVHYKNHQDSHKTFNQKVNLFVSLKIWLSTIPEFPLSCSSICFPREAGSFIRWDQRIWHQRNLHSNPTLQLASWISSSLLYKSFH